MPSLNTNTQRDRAATLLSMANLRAKADRAGAVDAMRLRAAAGRLEGDLAEDTAAAQVVPQPAQQAQAKARETVAEWAARMDRESPRPVEKLLIPAGYVASPAIRAMDRAAAEAGSRYAEAQNAVHAELGITAAPARAGPYGKAA